MKLFKSKIIVPLLGLFILVACSDSSNTDDTSPTATNSVVFPDTHGAPAQLYAKFDTGQCHVKTEIKSIGTGTDMSLNGVSFQLFDHQSISTKVGNFYTQKWGREGEYSMCAEVPIQSNVAILESELNQILNNYTGTIRGVVTITTN